MTSKQTSPSVDRVELILQQLQDLPTLSAIAARLLQVTADERSDARKVARIIESDPSMTARVLRMCTRADLGLGDKIKTVDRAVGMVGFDAVRNLVLSLEIYDVFSAGTTDEGASPVEYGPMNPRPIGFDRTAFWRHSVAVGTASALLAERAHPSLGVAPEEAFVCGLLHDLGKIALDWILPRAYERVVQLADRHLTSIAVQERKVLGLDHHTAGKRLAEHWQLPMVLHDVMWLHGQPYEALPELPHRSMIGLVSLADNMARRQHIGYSGNHDFNEDFSAFEEISGLTPEVVDSIVEELHDQVKSRADTLGLAIIPEPGTFLESIRTANKALGRINQMLVARSRVAARQERVLKAISTFHERLRPDQSAIAVCGQVVASAVGEWGLGLYAMVLPPLDGSQWQICCYCEDGRLLQSESVPAPQGVDDLGRLGDDMEMSVAVMGLLPWLQQHLGQSTDLRRVRLQPLRSGWGLSAILVHDRDLTSLGFTRVHMLALRETWGSAIAAARHLESSGRLSEQLAEANRVLNETQSRLSRTRAMASLGEMTAGAAHEMNNPLCVISGRSQVLAQQLTEHRHKSMAQQIVDQAHRLSDLITSLHLFAHAPRHQPHKVSLPDMIGRAIKDARQRVKSTIPVHMKVPEHAPAVWIDDEKIGAALVELIVNALEAKPRDFVGIQFQIDQVDDRLIIEVRDNGHGMSDRTLNHARDPFFSKKPAGRQPGLGLARAARLVEGADGVIELRSIPDDGTSATIAVGRWRPPKDRTPDRNDADVPTTDSAAKKAETTRDNDDDPPGTSAGPEETKAA